MSGMGDRVNYSAVHSSEAENSSDKNSSAQSQDFHWYIQHGSNKELVKEDHINLEIVSENGSSTSPSKYGPSDFRKDTNFIIQQVQLAIREKNYKRAISYQELLLQICCDLYGTENITTLTVMSNLAGLMYKENLNHVEDSEDLYIRTIAILKSEIERSEISTNIANTTNDTSDTTQAVSSDIFKCKELLGTTILELGNMLFQYNRTTRTNEILQLYMDSLKLYRSIFGESHPRTADALLHLAAVYTIMNEYELAKIRCEQALKIFLGIGGEYTATCEVVVDTMKDIIKKHVKYLQSEQFHIEAGVISTQLVLGEMEPLESIRGSPILSGWVHIPSSNQNETQTLSPKVGITVDHVQSFVTEKQKCFVCIFPPLLHSNMPIIHISWGFESTVISDSASSNVVWKAMASMFEDTRIGRLIALGASGGTRSSFGTDSVSSLGIDSSITVNSLDIRMIKASIQSHSDDGSMVLCEINGLTSDNVSSSSTGRRFSLGGNSRSRNNSVASTGSHSHVEYSTPSKFSLWLENMEEAHNWNDVLQQFLSPV